MAVTTHKAFVSSTYEDLKEHRKYVISTLRKSGIFVDPMEDWTSSKDEPKTFSCERMKGCDLCILLVARRRGHIPQGDVESITQIEYHTAINNGIDILVYMLDDNVSWPVQFDDFDVDPEIIKWRDQLLEKHGVDFFDTNPITIDISNALTRWMNEKTTNQLCMQENIVNGNMADLSTAIIGAGNEFIQNTAKWNKFIGLCFSIVFIGLLGGYLTNLLAYQSIIKPLPYKYEHLLYIVSIFWLIAFISILWSKIMTFLNQASGKITPVGDTESSYLNSLMIDLEKKNVKNSWRDAQYIKVNSVLIQENMDTVIQNQIAQSFYLVKNINRNTNDQDFNALTNVEKLDSSYGNTYSSLTSAIKNASDNAVVVIAPPGGGKTVSLRHLAISAAYKRLKRKTSKIPVFINLGSYNGFNSNKGIQPFESFLEQFFSTNGYYSFLANGKWLILLKEGRMQFYFDALDELPRKPEEYSNRTLEIEKFVRKWPKIDFVLSCRELDYDVQNTFQQILIKSFDYQHIKYFIKKTFSPEEYTVFLEQIQNSESISKLCENPFYLNLICLYFRLRKELPKNRTELFSYLLDKIIERENCKKTNPIQHITRDDFISVVSDLAYFMAVNRMTTTVVLSDYYNRLSVDLLKHHKNIISSAISCEILEYNVQNDDVRFIHNRFQEYFSSFVFANNYRNSDFAFPEGFFSNIWWRESILFIAGLDDKPSEFIELVLQARLNISEKREVIAKLLQLEILILAFQCTFCSLGKTDVHIRDRIRKLLIAEFEKGNILERAKIITVISNDQHSESQDIINKALNDSSSWLSENAFLLLSGGILRIKMRYMTIINEFLRFFFEGRIFETFLPIFKSTQQSIKIRTLFPLYIILFLASILSLIVIPAVIIFTLKFLILEMDYKISEYCINCLLSISLGAFLIFWHIVHTEGRLLRRTVLLTPLVSLTYLYIFNGFRLGDSMMARITGVFVGNVLAGICIRFLLRPRSPHTTLTFITVFLFGMFTTSLVFKAIHYPVNANPPDAFQNVTSDFIQPLIENRLHQSIAIIENNIASVNDRGKALSIVSASIDTIIAEKRIPTFLISSGLTEDIFKYKVIAAVRKKLVVTDKQLVQNNSNLDDAIKAGIGDGVSDISKTISVNIIKRYLYATILILLGMAVLLFIVWQGIIVYKISHQKKRIRRILERYQGNEFDLKNLHAKIQEIKEIWGKKVLVIFITKEIATKLNRADGSIVLFLNEFAKLIEQCELKDAIFRMLEREEREYRRTIIK